MIMEEQKNPEKIPLNPVQSDNEDKKLYQAKDDEETVAKREALKLLADEKKIQHTTLSTQQNLILVAMIIVIVLIAVAVGSVLFKDGFA
jgi:hypothetical protein